MEVTNLLTFDDRRQLRAWFEQNHRSEQSCWVACNRSSKPKPDTLPYIEIVEEALCFGWIDSTLKKLPDGRLAQRLSPRRERSHWTELNKHRCKDLEARGLMTDAGRKVLMGAVLSVFVFLLLCSCRQNKGDSVQAAVITAEMAYEGVNNYCHSAYDWSASEENPDMMYVSMGEETDSAFQVVFRSYTGALVYFYVDKESGTTRMVEYVPALDMKQEAGTMDIRDYLNH